MRLIAIPALIALSACAHITPPVKVEMQRLEVPVATSCVKRADIPAEPARTGVLPADARQAADLLGATLTDVRNWGGKLYAMLLGCSTD